MNGSRVGGALRVLSLVAVLLASACGGAGDGGAGNGGTGGTGGTAGGGAGGTGGAAGSGGEGGTAGSGGAGGEGGTGGVGGSGGSGSAPVLHAELLLLTQSAPGTADTLAGDPGAAPAAARVIAYADESLESEIAETSATSSGAFDAIPLGDNEHARVWLVAENAAGRSDAVQLYNDIEAPIASFDAAPPSPSNDPAFRFACNESSCTFACSLDGADFTTCDTEIALGGLAEGDHTLSLRAIDAAGNASETLDHTWHHDATAPVITTGPLPGPRTSDTEFEVTFACEGEDCSFECALDGSGPFSPCTSPLHLGPLAEGAPEFRIRATDDAGNRSVLHHRWFIDRTGPAVQFTTAPGPSTNVNPVDFVFSCGEEGCAWACDLDGSNVGCAGGLTASVNEGVHTLTVTAYDDLGNAGPPAAHTWALDRTAPNAGFVSTPPGLDNDTSPAFAFDCNEAACSFECRTDGGPWLPCFSPTGLGNLSEGGHTFALRARDPAGNASAEIGHSWTVDSVAPFVAIYSQPSGYVRADGGYVIFGTETGATVTCSLDGAASVACSSPYQPQLSDGPHDIVIRSSDAAGNERVVTIPTFTVDTVVPQVTFTQTPDAFSEDLSATFAWTCSESTCTFECSLDGGALFACTSPQSFTNLARGEHVFRVHARDPAGNVSVLGTTWRWSIRRLVATAAAGGSHSCAIDTAGALFCWGDNAYGQLGTGGQGGDAPGTPRRVETDTDWLTVATGESHSCAAKAGVVYCWGSNYNLKVGDSSSSNRYSPYGVVNSANMVQLALGAEHSCARRNDGTLWCWGSATAIGDTANRSVPRQIGTRTDWTDMGAGRGHTCAVAADHTLWCWGLNNRGQLGVGTSPSSSLAPVQVAGNDWVTVRAAGWNSCAIKQNGSLWCWGDNADGQLGVGTTTQVIAPSPVAPTQTFSKLAMGTRHTCALDTAGVMWCWGSNLERQLGDGTIQRRTMPVRVGGNEIFADLVAGGAHSCGVTAAGAMHCFGSNESGQLGVGFDGERASPTQVPQNSVATVGVGNSHACAVDAGGAVWCWGDTSWEQPSGDDAPRDLPQGFSTGALRVDLGTNHGCYLASDHSLRCWGANGWGALGNGINADSRAVPVRVGSTTDVDWAQFDSGSDGVCAVKFNGSLWCWGNNAYGQLGQGGSDYASHNVPVRVGTANDWRQVSVGDRHVCAVKTNGDLWCWGSNSSGQLGIGNTNTSFVPMYVGAGWAEVSAGMIHTCARKTNNTLFCWGDSLNGKLGRYGGQQNSPVQVGTDSNWTSIRAGRSHNCGLRGAGELWCFGGGDKRQNGSTTPPFEVTPLRVGSDADWVDVSVGGWLSCGVRSNGSTWCWGGNDRGALGDGTAFFDAPVEVELF